MVVSCGTPGTGRSSQVASEEDAGAAEGDEGEYGPEGGAGTAEAEIEAPETVPVKIWLEDIIPEAVKDMLAPFMEDNEELEPVQDREEAEVLLEMVPAGTAAGGYGATRELDMSYVIAPALPFFSLADSIEWEDFRAWWSGDDGALACTPGGEAVPLLELSGTDYDLLVKMLGDPGNQNILITDKQAASAVPGGESKSFFIVPFDMISKELKVLEINGLSVFDRELRLEDYPFAFAVRLSGDDAGMVDDVYSRIGDASYTNRDVSRMTTLMMTGVTAMARFKNIGRKMDEMGVLYPALQIADILRSADITHISNEIPFVEGCSSEDRFPYMCSDPSYMELLRYVGTDVVELTGNHMNDYGGEWMLYTIGLYEGEGWPYFGGGKDLEDCFSPAVLESNGNRFAFLGFNWWGPEYAWAAEDRPGSSPGPGEEYFARFEEKVRELKSQGYIVVFTFQYLESESYSPVSQQVTDFRRMIDAGADIVSGSQSHYPMGVELYEHGFINYGLGNLFFNMRDIPGLKQGIIAEHVIYDGRHINTVLITTMLEDLSQVRLTTPEERAELLDLIFEGSIR